MAWINLAWHHSVREKFGEHLVFYRACLQHFHPEKTPLILSKLFTAEQINNLTVYMVFGATDILIYGYLHPNLIEDFRFRLAEALETETTPEYFAVARREEHEFKAAGTAAIRSDHNLYHLLDVQTIRTVQLGENPDLLARLIEAGLVEHTEEHGEQLIRFFMAVALDTTEALLDRAQTTIREHLRKQATLVSPRLLRGRGFAVFLIDAHVEPANYFTIGELSKWLISELDPFKAKTETYLASEPDSLIPGANIIDDRTFIVRRSTSPLIQSILPEVYNTATAISDEIILALSDGSVNATRLLPQDRALLGAFLKGVLDSNEMQSIGHLLFFLTHLEGYLRTAHARYAQSKGFDLKVLYDLAGIKEANKNHTLVDYLNTLTKVFEDQKQDSLTQSAKECLRLLPLRNELAHGRYTLAKWPDDLHVLIQGLPHLRSVLGHLADETGLIFKN
ncbi:MAG TPA: hypothetical protein VHW45_20190 [Candidatus Sulfotelmatobacter sp.]|jgi:hypothetical protein|nr:hypothetical protein [Candidatus Sulfotelmatobacter sp.]